MEAVVCLEIAPDGHGLCRFRVLTLNQRLQICSQVHQRDLLTPKSIDRTHISLRNICSCPRRILADLYTGVGATDPSISDSV